MIKEAFGKGSTIDEAKNAAFEALNAPADADVSYEVIAQAKPKKFGLFGGSDAEIRAYYESEEEEIIAEVKAEAKVEIQVAEDDEKFAAIKTYINNILVPLGVSDANIKIVVVDGDVKIDITCGDDYGSVIGRRGETLDAIQYLVRLTLNRGKEDYNRVSINVGDYRQKRENTLKALARKNAEKVRKYGRNIALDPMNPYERRIIHTTIQEIEGVTSHSVGSDDERKVIITLEEGVKPLNGGNGNRGNRGGYNRGRGSNRSAETVSDVPARAPRSDSEGVSLYGKIK